MVNKYFPLIAIFGLVFMTVGAYIALAQDSSQTMTITMSQVPTLAIYNELRSNPDIQVTITLPDGQVRQAVSSQFDFTQFMVPNLPQGNYQITLVKPGNSPRNYSFSVMKDQKLVIPSVWMTGAPASAPPIVASPTQVPPVPTQVIQPTQVSAVPTQVIQATQVPTQTTPQSAMQTPVVQPTQVIDQPTEVIPTLVPDGAPTLVPPTPVPAALGQIAGVVLYENTQKQVAIRLNLTRLDNTSEMVEATSDSSGTFQFADLPLGIYQLDASAPGFLSSRMEVRVLEGQLVQLPPTTLKAGDINQDGLIDIKDVTLVAANFDGPAAVVETDINGDGWVDIRDLSVVGSQFGLAGPLPWN